MTVSFTITGRPISKKNSKQLIRVGGRIVPISSKAYLRFEKDALMQLLPYRKYRFNRTIKVEYHFYIQGKYHVDGDNLMAGINDILQKSGIILDDDLIIEGCFKKYGGSAGWSTKISISDY